MTPSTPPVPRHPDYPGNCLTQVLPSALSVLTRVEPVLPLPAADRVVVLVVDGLGQRLLESADAELVPFMSGMTPLVPGGIDSAFPSTTATSLTSLGTGLPPGRHGVVGLSFWLPETDSVLHPLRWRESPPAAVVQPNTTLPAVAERAAVAVTAVGPRDFESSGLTNAAFRGARYAGADSPGELIVAVAAAAGARPPALVYGYFAHVDKSGHLHGPGSPQWELDLQWTDRAVAAIAERLPRGTLLLLTADHGMVDSPPEARIDVEAPEFADGVRLIAGEPRVRHVYLEDGADAREVAQRWQGLLGSSAIVLTQREAIIDAGLFGDIGFGMRQRIGDVLAIATGSASMTRMSAEPFMSSLRGQHGGLTDEELRVPLLAWTC